MRVPLLELTTDQYQSLRSALRQIQCDRSAVGSVLSAQSDSGAGFVEAAYAELRRALVQGRLDEAEELGETIAVVLEVQEGEVADELAENRIHRESLRWLIDGIGAILGQDTVSGIALLENLTGAVYSNESLQWVAWLWVARASVEAGDIDPAQQAAREACELADRLDAQAVSTSLLTLGQIKIQRGEYDQALQHLSQAGQTFEEFGDRRGLAATWLARARAHAAAGDWGLGHGAAAWAAEIDAEWPDPVVFLARQAIIGGDLDEAERVISSWSERDPRPAEIERELHNLQRLRNNSLDRALYCQYLELSEKPPTDALVDQLEAMLREHPDFHLGRDLLAWTLAKLSRDEDALRTFEHLSTQQLEPFLHTSVLLGLGCLANRANLHRQPGARIRAAAARSREPAAIPEPSPPPSQAEPPTADDIEFKALDELEMAEAEQELLPPPPVDVAGIAAPGVHHTKRFRNEDDDVPQPTYAESPKAVFTGTLQLFAVPDLLEFLKSSRRTGTLVVTSEKGIGAVHMRGGLLTGAASPACTNLGDLLLETQAITQDQLQAAARTQQREAPDHLLGAILVEIGVDRTAVQRALAKQIHEAIFELVGWTTGHFAFEPDRGQQHFPGEIVVELDTQAVLLEVLRQFDESNK